ncbi:MAG TPA: hypothetical protein VFB36_03365 [Nevskiaceae bacterium]|nr:hypothetical protein [Nevskiaceae bacterium]
MIRCLLLLLGFTAGVAMAATPAAPGTTIVGDREAAVGLFLDAWREEAASDLDWPPVHEAEPLAPLDQADVRRTIELEAQRDAVRRARLQTH